MVLLRMSLGTCSSKAQFVGVLCFDAPVGSGVRWPLSRYSGLRMLNFFLILTAYCLAAALSPNPRYHYFDLVCCSLSMRFMEDASRHFLVISNNNVLN